MPRPSFRPTRDQRRLVKSLAAIGLLQDQIAKMIGIRSPKTLRKHFRKELTAGVAEAIATVSRAAYEMAVSGRYPDMTDYWLSTMDVPAESIFAAEDELLPARHTSTSEVIFPPEFAREASAEVTNAAA
jgi:hypothetical protein